MEMELEVAAAANNMELDQEDSMFMQWAVDTLLPPQEIAEEEEDPAAAVVDDGEVVVFPHLQDLHDASVVVDGGGGEVVVFPSLQALRDASQAAEMVRELMAADEPHDAANSWTTSAGSGAGDGGAGEVTDGGSSGATTDPPPPAPAADYYGGGSWPPPAASGGNAGITAASLSLPAVSWNFVTGSAQPGGDGGVLEDAAAAAAAVHPTTRSVPPELLAHHHRPAARRRSPPPPRRAAAHPLSSASCTPDHIVAERKRREKINKRLIELSTVVPGLKKMDKATILSDAAKYVKELQKRLKDLEEAAAAAAAGSKRSKAAAPATDENNGGGARSPTSASSSSSGPPALPEIEVRFAERNAMVRIHCGGGKGVAAAALAAVEGLGLTVVHANVMPFSACTIVITITAEMEGRLTLTTEQIVDKLKSALPHRPSISCNDTEETEN